MLKITFSETPAEERWILHGRLTHPWVQEFMTCWKKNHRKDARRVCIVDLNEVTFIDKSGERFLRLLARNGAQFTASGIYTKRILEQLNLRRKHGFSSLLGFLIVLVFATALGAGCEPSRSALSIPRWRLATIAQAGTIVFLPRSDWLLSPNRNGSNKWRAFSKCSTRVLGSQTRLGTFSLSTSAWRDFVALRARRALERPHFGG